MQKPESQDYPFASFRQVGLAGRGPSKELLRIEGNKEMFQGERSKMAVQK
jgi:putative heme iron utilization protein